MINHFFTLMKNFNVDKIDIMSIGVISISSIAIMLLSEIFNTDTKNSYEEKYGKGSWKNVLIGSIFFGVVSGYLSGLGAGFSADKYLMLYLANFGTIVGYVSYQSIITDPALHKVDRYMLRIGYIDSLFLTILYLFKMYGNGEALLAFSIPIILIYVVLIVMFIFSSIGPSDVRAIAVFLPFIAAVNLSLSLFSLLIVTVITMIFMTYKKHKEHNPKYAVPILPTLMVPYMFLVPIFPLAINWYLTLSLKR